MSEYIAKSLYEGYFFDSHCIFFTHCMYCLRHT